MTKQIGNKMVPNELYAYATMLNKRGAKVYLSVMADEQTGHFPLIEGQCTNCNGGRKLMLEWYVTAGTETPVTVQPNRSGPGENNPTIAMWDAKRGKWFGKKIKVYPCPVCSVAPQTTTAEIRL